MGEGWGIWWVLVVGGVRKSLVEVGVWDKLGWVFVCLFVVGVRCCVVVVWCVVCCFFVCGGVRWLWWCGWGLVWKVGIGWWCGCCWWMFWRFLVGWMGWFVLVRIGLVDVCWWVCWRVVWWLVLCIVGNVWFWWLCVVSLGFFLGYLGYFGCGVVLGVLGLVGVLLCLVICVGWRCCFCCWVGWWRSWCCRVGWWLVGLWWCWVSVGWFVMGNSGGWIWFYFVKNKVNMLIMCFVGFKFFYFVFICFWCFVGYWIFWGLILILC